MKREAIKKAVERAADKFMPRAVREEGEYRAREKVREAMYEQPGTDDPDAPGDAAPSPASGTTVISSAAIERRLGRGG